MSDHPSHSLKAYMGDFKKPTVFCEKCGKEEDEGLDQPCTDKIYVPKVDTLKERS